MFSKVRPKPKSFSLRRETRSAESRTESIALTFFPEYVTAFQSTAMIHSNCLCAKAREACVRANTQRNLVEKLGHSDATGH